MGEIVWSNEWTRPPFATSKFFHCSSAERRRVLRLNELRQEPMKTAENKKVNHVGLNCAPRIYRNPPTLRPSVLRVSVNEPTSSSSSSSSSKIAKNEIVARPSTLLPLSLPRRPTRIIITAERVLNEKANATTIMRERLVATRANAGRWYHHHPDVTMKKLLPPLATLSLARNRANK